MRYLITLLLTTCFTVFSVAQKIKYKDLFFLLDTDNYEQAEPLLRQYLKDPKNAQEANPNLQMAFIFHKNSDNTDILLNSEEYINHVDSAVMFYEKSKLYLDEKEVSKKNKDYYVAYQRRDIRTGKFGIKLADVILDIDNRIKSITERKNLVQELKIYHEKALSNYQQAQSEFKKIKDEYPSQKVLYLRSNEALTKRLDDVASNAQLALENVNAFEATIKKIPKSGYHPAIHVREIIDYEKDGESTMDLTLDNVDFWDYKSWSASVKNGVQQTIVPMRTQLIEFDQDLTQLLERVKKDSMSLSDRIPPMNSIMAKIREYDNDPLPEYLFKFKIKNIENESYKMEHLYYRDSSDILFQMEVANIKFENYSEMDSLLKLLVGRDYSEDQLNYENFIKNQYQDISGLESYIKSEFENVVNHKRNSENEINALIERSRWLIGETDSIPLFKEVNVGLSKHVPLTVEDAYTSGFYFSGESPAEGYFATVTNARDIDLYATFKIDNEHFNKQNLEVTSNIISQDDGGHFYVILLYTQLPEQDANAASIAKIYTSDGLAWNKNLTLSTVPKAVLINDNTGDIIIEYDMENYLGQDEIQDRVVLTKKGDIKE